METTFDDPDLSAVVELVRLKLPVRRVEPGKVRLVKDVLHVGEIRDGFEFTADVLVELASTLNSQVMAGEKPPLTWNHPGRNDSGEYFVDARDRIAPIEWAGVTAGRLWLAVYVPKDIAENLRDTEAEVSAGVVSGFPSESLGVLNLSIHHVAVVNHPRITNQKRFIHLGPDGPKGTAMFDTLKPQIARLVEAAGGTLPDNVTEENVEVVLPVIVDAILGKASSKPAADTVDEMPAGDLELSRKLKETEDRLAKVEAERNQSEAKRKEDAFAAKCDSIGLKGETRTEAIELGRRLDFDEAVLKPYQSKATGSRKVRETSGESTGVPKFKI